MTEKIILETTSKHMKAKVAGYSQHGFMKGKTFLLNMVAFCNELTSPADQEGAVDIVYLNFEEAFDAVCCNISIDK